MIKYFFIKNLIFKFNCRYITIACMATAYANCCLYIFFSLLHFSKHSILPINTWVFYDLHNPFNYWLSFAHQSLSFFISTTVGVACDNLVTGFMMEGCVQFRILEFRIKSLPKIIEKSKLDINYKLACICEEKIMCQHVRHHVFIHRQVFEYIF